MKRQPRPFFPVLLLFLAVNAFLLLGKNRLDGWGADQTVLIFGNLVLFIITLVSFLIALKSMQTKNPQAIVRFVYGSILFKFFACILAAVIYIMIEKGDVNKPALFICLGLYVAYTFLEVAALMKLSKQNSNA
jgi:hypothetical protein